MSWLDGLILAFAERLVSKLAARAVVEVKSHAERLQRDREREEIDADNLKQYNAALNRKDRIERALKLLNRTRRVVR